MASLGLREGLAAYGVKGKPILAVEPDVERLATYGTNLRVVGSVLVPITTEEAVAEGLPSADLIITGPPCQGDSTLNRCQLGRRDRRSELAGAKIAAVVQGRRVVMEVVGNHWDEWAQGLGAQRLRLRDCDLGGFTLRRRTFFFWGFGPIRRPVAITSPGWGAVLPWLLTRFGYLPEVLLASEGHAVAKRWKFARPQDEPAHAVLGQGAAHLVIDADTGRKLYRLTPEDEAALSGFPDLHLFGPVRERQTQVGNGWPASFGHFIAWLLLEDL